MVCFVALDPVVFFNWTLFPPGIDVVAVQNRLQEKEERERDRERERNFNLHGMMG